MKQPFVSIIILNWNGLEDTIECLNSLSKIKYKQYHIILVDNGSSFEESEILRKKYKNLVDFIRNETNKGVAEGNNIGIKYALSKGTDYLLLLNNDTNVKPNFLNELVNIAKKNSKIGIVGPKILCYDNPTKIWTSASNINYKCLFLSKKIKTNHICDVNYISGCCMLIKKEVVSKVGLFDPIFFCYGEENDLCIRTINHNYRIVYCPNSIIYHKISRSTNGGFNKVVAYYKVRNKIILMKKNFTFNYWIFFLPYLIFFILYHSFESIYHKNFLVMKSMLLGILWHFRFKKGDKK